MFHKHEKHLQPAFKSNIIKGLISTFFANFSLNCFHIYITFADELEKSWCFFR